MHGDMHIYIYKLAKYLQLIVSIKRTIFKKVRTETTLKIYDTLVLPTFLMGQKIGLVNSLTKTKN